MDITSTWIDNDCVYLTASVDLKLKHIVFDVCAIEIKEGKVDRRAFSEGEFASAVNHYNAMVNKLQKKHKRGEYMGYVNIDNERLRELLQRAINALEDAAGVETLLDTDLEEEVGITEEEYYAIKGPF